MPKPRKLRLASAMINVPMRKVPRTKMDCTMLGRISLEMMVPEDSLMKGLPDIVAAMVIPAKFILIKSITSLNLRVR